MYIIGRGGGTIVVYLRDKFIACIDVFCRDILLLTSAINVSGFFGVRNANKNHASFNSIVTRLPNMRDGKCHPGIKTTS